MKEPSMEQTKIASDFSDFIHQNTGIRYRPENYFQLMKRMTKVIQEEDVIDEETLLAKIRTAPHGPLAAKVLDIATNNETLFFRDKHVFTAFEKILSETEKTHIRIWSAACSTGQEPYSLAMTLESWVKSKSPHLTYEIIATDFSPRVLNKAKQGVYSQLEVERGLPDPLKAEWFTQQEETWTIQPSLRNHIQFKTHNLLDPSLSQGEFDFIFLRNVLIYFETDKKQDILNKMSRNLKDTGLLLLGCSESLIGLDVSLEQQAFHSALFYRRKT